MKMNFKMLGLKAKLGAVAMVAGAILISGCSSTAYKPEIAESMPRKDGVLYVDLRNNPLPLDYRDIKTPVERLLKESCVLPVNVEHPVCRNPNDFVMFSAQVRNAMWGERASVCRRIRS